MMRTLLIADCVRKAWPLKVLLRRIGVAGVAAIGFGSPARASDRNVAMGTFSAVLAYEKACGGEPLSEDEKTGLSAFGVAMGLETSHRATQAELLRRAKEFIAVVAKGGPLAKERAPKLR